MTKSLPSLVGERFSRWTVIAEARPRVQPSGQRKRQWLCRCSCGTEAEIQQHSLLSGSSQSCGCYKREVNKRNATTHGQAANRVYKVWSSMLSRCQRPTSSRYADYGGRGIKVCEQWQTFEGFYADMGEPPAGCRHTLERMDNDGDYCLDNCRWATYTEQARNRRSTRWLLYQGESRSLAEVAELLGISQARLSKRLKLGWDERDWGLPKYARPRFSRTEPLKVC